MNYVFKTFKEIIKCDFRRLHLHQRSHVLVPNTSTTTAKILDGRQLAEELRTELRHEVDSWMGEGHRAPALVAILVGANPASEKYVRNKMIAAKSVGITSSTIHLPATISEADLVTKVAELNVDTNVDGILVQLPVPPHIDERRICSAVDPRKDVDGFHLENLGKLAMNLETMVPCTAMAVVEILRRSQIKTFGKTIVVCGRSKNVGLPISLLLHSDARNELSGLEATVIMCHRNTPPEELGALAKRADIIVSATGVVGLIRGDMVKPGATIIDVGITQVQKTDGSGGTRLVGDAAFEECSKVAGYITPVPGGVGPMTVACLMKNTFKAAVALNHHKNSTDQ